METANNIFRAGVGAIILDRGKRVLACRRTAQADGIGSGSWQMPQGGLDGDEDLRAALFREVKEETGISSQSLEIMAHYPYPLSYEFPEERRLQARGQTHYWFLLRFTGDDGEIDVTRDDEFDGWKWTTLHALADEVWEGKRHIYQILADHFKEFLAR